MDFSADTTKLYLLCAVTPCLLVLCWYDCKYRKLPNVMTIGLAALALLCRVFTGGMAGLYDGLIGGLVCGFFLFIPFLMKSAGGGDCRGVHGHERDTAFSGAAAYPHGDGLCGMDGHRRGRGLHRRHVVFS